MRACLHILPLLLAVTSASVTATPVGFPPTGAGWTGGPPGPGDVARYLAFHKLRAVFDPLALASPPTANQQAYDAMRVLPRGDVSSFMSQGSASLYDLPVL